MKLLAIHGPSDIRWEDAPTPEPGDDEIRLRVKYVGICGSDLHYYFHGANGEYLLQEPLTPGHELSATVDLDPSGRFAPGTPVTVHPARFGPTTVGLEDRPHLCAGGDYLGSAATTPHRQGGAAEYLLVGADMVRPLPANLSLKRAALAEPLAVALHAVGMVPDLNGRSVLITGAGPIGLLVLAAARAAGAERITVTDLQEAPLALATRIGASEVRVVGQDPTDASSFDVVFECSGSAPALSQAVRAAAPAGTLVQVGMLPNEAIGVNLSPVLAKELTIHGAFRFSSEIDAAITMLADGEHFDAVVTHVVPAERAPEAFALARDSSDSSKVLLAL